MAGGGPVTDLPHCLFRLGSYLSSWRNLLVSDWFIFCAPEGDCTLPRPALHSAQHAEEHHHPTTRSCTRYGDTADLTVCQDWNIRGLTWHSVMSSMGELQVFLKERERLYLGKPCWAWESLADVLPAQGWLPGPGGLECPTSRASVSWKHKRIKRGAAARQRQVEVCRLVLLHTHIWELCRSTASWERNTFCAGWLPFVRPV